MTNADFIAILISLIGAWLLYRSRKRVFDRKNAYGHEVFTSNRGKLLTRSLDNKFRFPPIVPSGALETLH